MCPWLWMNQTATDIVLVTAVMYICASLLASLLMIHIKRMQIECDHLVTFVLDGRPITEKFSDVIALCFLHQNKYYFDNIVNVKFNRCIQKLSTYLLVFIVGSYCRGYMWFVFEKKKFSVNQWAKSSFLEIRNFVAVSLGKTINVFYFISILLFCCYFSNKT